MAADLADDFDTTVAGPLDDAAPGHPQRRRQPRARRRAEDLAPDPRPLADPQHRGAAAQRRGLGPAHPRHRPGLLPAPRRRRPRPGRHARAPPPAEIDAIRRDGRYGELMPGRIEATGDWLATVALPLETELAGRNVTLLRPRQPRAARRAGARQPLRPARRDRGRRRRRPHRPRVHAARPSPTAPSSPPPRRSSSPPPAPRRSRATSGPTAQAMLGAYAFPDAFPWAVITELSEANAYAVVNHMLRNLLLVGLAGFGVAAAAALFFAGRLTGPILKIGAVAERVGRATSPPASRACAPATRSATSPQRMNAMIRELSERLQLLKFVSRGTVDRHPRRRRRRRRPRRRAPQRRRALLRHPRLHRLLRGGLARGGGRDAERLSRRADRDRRAPRRRRRQVHRRRGGRRLPGPRHGEERRGERPRDPARARRPARGRTRSGTSTSASASPAARWSWAPSAPASGSTSPCSAASSTSPPASAPPRPPTRSSSPPRSARRWPTPPSSASPPCPPRPQGPLRPRHPLGRHPGRSRRPGRLTGPGVTVRRGKPRSPLPSPARG